MNLNNEEEDSVFNQHCLELAKLLRTEQTEDFLHLYDSLPSEWNGLREYLQLETAKEYIRQLQELDENEFELTYQRAFQNGRKTEQYHQTIIMSNLPIQSAVIRNNDNDGEQTITANSQITSVSFLQQKQHNERITANNLACDEQHDLSSKRCSSIKKNNDEFNTKTRRLQSITNNNTHDIIQNNCRTRTPVDSFVQLNLKPSSIDIRLEDYKKARDPMSATQTSSINNRSSIPQSIDANKLNQQGIIQSNIGKKSKTSTTNKSHEEASFDYFFKNDDDPRQHSRSRSSSSSSTHNKNDLSINQILSQSNSCAHSKLIENNDFDSHGSSIATKSSSENSGSARTGSGSDSDDEHHHHHHHHQCEKKPILSTIKSSLSSKDKSFNYDDTPTIVLNKTSDNRTNQNDRLSSLPVQNSYELVKLNSNDEHPLLYQVPRLKQPVTDEPNGINNSNNDILPHTTPRSQQNNLSSSSHQNRNSERHEPNNTNHSNSSRKLQNRPSKKRKQSQQQEIIRTELIPGHRGDLDVDELVMFIDGNSSSKQQQQRQNSAPLRPTDTNSNNTNSTSRRKSRKPIKIFQETINNNENKTSQIDEDTQSIGFIDEDDQTTTTITTTHSLNNTYNEQISLPNDDDESYSNTIDIDSNTTNGEVFLPEWHSTSPPNDDIDLLSLSSTTLNNSNSEIISEPFVTVTHRRRSIKERRQDNNNNNNNNLSSRTSRLLSSSNINDKRRFQSGISTQNGILRPTIKNSLSNIKPFVSTTTKEEENTNIISPPLPVSQISQLPSTSISNNLPEQSSPRLSSHSSSSSLSSLLKRQSKAPPVVFLNKSIDIELNDVSFGFDIENSPSDKPSTPPLPSEPSIEKEINPSSNDLLTNSKSSYSRRSYQQRNSRGPLFYSGSDIRPHHHRNYPSQIPVSQSSYIDPLVLLQYNQQYYQQLAYMNLLRSQYLSSQSQYVFIPTKSTYETNQDEKNLNDETSEQIQEPLLVYTTTLPNQTGGPIYYHSTKKSFNNFDQSSIYPSQYFYPTHSAYFQPISSLLIDNKSQQDDTDHDDDEEDNNYEKSTKFFHQTSQQSSSHIMSNALHLVYSQEKRNAQTDRFNLDQLTGYLAMKWTDTIDHYEQGDDEILLVSEQE